MPFFPQWLALIGSSIMRRKRIQQTIIVINCMGWFHIKNRLFLLIHTICRVSCFLQEKKKNYCWCLPSTVRMITLLAWPLADLIVLTQHGENMCLKITWWRKVEIKMIQKWSFITVGAFFLFFKEQKLEKQKSFALTLPAGLHINNKRHNDEDFTFQKSCLEIY